MTDQREPERFEVRRLDTDEWIEVVPAADYDRVVEERDSAADDWLRERERRKVTERELRRERMKEPVVTDEGELRNRAEAAERELEARERTAFRLEKAQYREYRGRVGAEKDRAELLAVVGEHLNHDWDRCADDQSLVATVRRIRAADAGE